MNRSLAKWLADNPGGAVVVTALLGLLPLRGIGLAFFLPGVVPALVTLVRGPRTGSLVALGAGLLLVVAVAAAGRPATVGLITAAWLLVPPLLIAVLYARTESLSLCLQLATLLCVGFLAVMHLSLGDPMHFWEPFIRALAEGVRQQDLPQGVDKDELLELLARTLWGWMAVLLLLQGMLALFVARWLQTAPVRQGAFGAEFRQLRLGVVLGTVAGVVVVLAMFTGPLLIDDLRSLFIAALTLVGLAALHRAVVSGRLRRAWLWFTYILLGLVVTAAPVVIVLAGWGFVDNWLRSQRVAAAGQP
jgi:hypothetical protein